MKITYFVEIFSSWCHWAEPTWAELKNRYAGSVEFDWKIALMNPGDFPANRAQCDWFYRRSGTVMRSPYMLNSGWLEPERNGQYEAANWVAEAGRTLGVTDDRLRLALAEAALRNGQRLGSLALAAEVGAKAVGLDSLALRSAAESTAVHARVAETTAEFHSLRLTQRPAFVLENKIGDRAVFSGLVALAPLAASIDAMLSDAAAYRSYETHFGKVS
ncbi:DsbA family protein [Nibricoccus sp. IMCC34717]|uniref:DsbA family oxidoreductase n=1 Tax=Nibricoccus sp. IMCC34717 TaxID=3034021 RepID=UPI00384EB697